MKKILVLCAVLMSLAFGIEPKGDLPDYTPMFAIRSLQTGISISIFRESSQDLTDQNWVLREITLSDKLKAKDTLADKFPFGYVQFVNPNDDDICLAILESGFFGVKSCKGDLEDEKLETVFSIMPTTSSAVQIRSLVLGGVECISTFRNPQIPLETRIGIQECFRGPHQFIAPFQLLFFTPAIVEATPLN
ncbi:MULTISPECIES: RICIN domain-containing protein [Campylobacter]|uniref:Cytolethal distending toxin subunit A n=1 Tax=Campylobacter taeniopygiae TaxID=2510188 RepID=A0ABY2TKZ3_9BACT|nr:cytolethal distending toxin subunit A [Campylobacter taeniopygiae]MBZ7935056.1 cytolethal distending toxin subunit A [Campylobacter sp. B0100352/1]MBZ7963583.1 cytolethal distending toxin subunit A [Campylobacter sp. 2457A]TKX34642.1 cytolethal distending toxin subunit A [Campylobacter taeniopygiae]